MKSTSRMLLAFVALVGLGAAQSQWNQPGNAELIINNTNNPSATTQQVTLLTGSQTSIQFRGQANVPFAIWGAPTTINPGIPVLGGQYLDLNPATMFDLFAGFPQSLFFLDGTGNWTTSFTLDPNTTVGTRIVLQGIAYAPNYPAGAALTAAADCTVQRGLTVIPIPLSGQGSRNIALPTYSIANLPFYASRYTSLFVNADGNLTFNSSSGDFTPTPTELHSGAPRIAPFWCDLEPQITGSIQAVVDPNGTFGPSFKVEYDRMPEWNNAGSLHTFSVEIFELTGDIQIYHDLFNLAPVYDVMTGIAPGSNQRPSGMNPYPAYTDFSTFGPANPKVGLPLESFWEWYGRTTMTYYTQTFNNPYDLTGRTVYFTAVGTGSAGGFYTCASY